MEKFRNWAIRKLGGVRKETYEMACSRALHEQGLRESLEKKLYEAEGDYRKIASNVRKIAVKYWYDPELYEKHEKELLDRVIRESLAKSLVHEILQLIHIEDEPRPGNIKCAMAFVRLYVEDET